MLKLIKDILESNKTLLFILFLLSMIITCSFCVYWILEVNEIVKEKEKLSYLIEIEEEIIWKIKLV